MMWKGREEKTGGKYLSSSSSSLLFLLSLIPIWLWSLSLFLFLHIYVLRMYFTYVGMYIISKSMYVY